MSSLPRHLAAENYLLLQARCLGKLDMTFFFPLTAYFTTACTSLKRMPMCEAS
jgi:hypothetical protein